MWQRKQTVFLAIAAFCLIIMIFFPVWRAQKDAAQLSIFPLHFSVKNADVTTTSYFPYSLIAIFAIAAATIAIISIGKFENRLLQIKLGALNSLIMALSMGTAVWLTTGMMKEQQVAGEYGYSLFLPGIAMICNMVANRFIRRDEKLVRDSDRLR